MSRQIIYAMLIAAGCSIFLACSNPDPVTKKQPADTSRVDSVETLDDRYSNPEFNLAFRMPSSWILVEEPISQREEKAINLFKKGTGAEQDLPLGVHAEADHSYISILPGGWGTELPNSQYSSFTQAEENLGLSFGIDTAKSKILHLKDGSPWAYFIAPAEPPENWSDSGFIFAQIQTKQDTTYCIDAETGEKQPVKRCDYSQGDQYIREGERNEKDATIIHNILASFSLEEIQEKEAASEMIEIENPTQNMDISSPLTIKGEAKGYWYYEGLFTIKLYTANDSLLAETTAEADGKWMTEQFVPFETTITFETPDDQRGRLVFERANPSGLPQNEQSHTLPVIFPSQ